MEVVTLVGVVMASLLLVLAAVRCAGCTGSVGFIGWVFLALPSIRIWIRIYRVGPAIYVRPKQSRRQKKRKQDCTKKGIAAVMGVAITTKREF